MTLGDPAALRRTAALLILAALAAAVWIGPVGAYRGLLDDAADRIAAQAALLARYRALAQTEPAAPDAAASGPSLIYPDIPESQATALLQEAVKAAAAAARVQVQGLQVLRSETMPGAVRIGVRIRAAGDIASLRGLIYAVEAARPVLYPDNLQIQSHAMTPAAATAPLDFQLDISGFKPGSGS